MFDNVTTFLLVATATILELLGIVFAIHALFRGRTVQGTIAWGISLVTVPYFAVPLYLIIGRGKFHGYVRTRREGQFEASKHKLSEELFAQDSEVYKIYDRRQGVFEALERLAMLPMTAYNDVRLLIDGEQTFRAIFESIDSARDYLLVQFYIFRDDDLGRDFKRRLLERAAAGVRIYVIYDEIGSAELSSRYFKELRRGGVEVRSFHTTKGRRNRFQINFRNHRKIVLVDGKEAFVGGHNVGDEYLGKSPRFGPWRDTHVRVAGAAVQSIQLSFWEDWHWAAGEYLDLDWPIFNERIEGDGEGTSMLVLPSGPADQVETCALFFVHAITCARRRLWIASPYFVPSSDMTSALSVAALRGVDVRIIVPLNPDRRMVQLASVSFFEQLAPLGIKIYRYKPGFMHQKVVLVDDDIATVGTANFDNRSFRLNFELSLVCANTDFAREVEQMLLADMERSDLVKLEEFAHLSFPQRVAVKVARLFAPVL